MSSLDRTLLPRPQQQWKQTKNKIEPTFHLTSRLKGKHLNPLAMIASYYGWKTSGKTQKKQRKKKNQQVPSRAFHINWIQHEPIATVLVGGFWTTGL